VRFLLRPAWLALIAVVIGFVVLAVTVLAPWQFDREADREAQQAAIDAASALPPVPLGEVVAPGQGVEADDAWARVELTGSYLPAAEALVRLRVVDGKPAFEVLTPFRTSDGRLLTVGRGSVTAPDVRVVPDFAAPPEGTVTIEGRLRVDESDPQDRPVLTTEGHRQLYAADSRALAAATGLALEPGYVALAPDQPGVLTPLPVEPGTGGAPFTNLSYALQWLTFGAIALFALAWFVRLELLQRRGERAAVRRDLAGDDSPAPPGETPLAERYGRR
jgi:cytochrome oxidase assembly protein ShyY1